MRLPGAESCVATQTLARAVEQRIGRPVFVSAAAADVSVEGRIEPVRGRKGFRATITLRDGKGALLGTRELERTEPSCEPMTDPLALVIAVMIDPDAALGPKPQPSTEPAPTTPPTPEREIVVQKEPVYVPIAVPVAGTAKRPAAWFFEGSAAFVTALGLQPKPSLGAGVNAILEPPRLVPLEVFGAVFFDSSSPGDHGYVTLDVAYVGSGLCPLRWRGSRVHFFGCIESHLGITRARSGGFDANPTETFRPLVDSALSGRATLRIGGPFALRAGISAFVPLLRYRYTVQQDDGARATVFTASPVAAALDVGLGLALP